MNTTRTLVLLTTLIGVFVLVPRGSHALEARGDLARSIQELRECGLTKPSEGWGGARWACDGLEITKSFIRRVGGFIAGVDPADRSSQTSGGNQLPNLVDTYGFAPDDQKLLRSLFYANFYLPAELSAPTQTSTGKASAGLRGPVVAGAATAGEVRGTHAAAGTSTKIRDWGSFLTEQAPPTKNPLGKASLLGLAGLGRYQMLSSAYHDVTVPGGIFPVFVGEQRQGDTSKTSTKRPSDAIIQPQANTSFENQAALEAPLLATVAGNYAPPAPKGSPSEPIKSADEEKRGEATETPTEKQDAAPLGTAVEIGSGQPRDGSGLSALSCPTCGGASQTSGLFGNFLSGAPLSQALGRFGRGGLGNLAGILGPELFRNSLLNRFPPGGGGAAQPTSREIPPSGICASRPPPILSMQEIQNIADFLGLPVTETPWTVEYRPTSTVVGAQGINIRSNQPVTVDDRTFSDQPCVRSATAVTPLGERHTLLLSDTRSANGTLIALSPPP